LHLPHFCFAAPPNTERAGHRKYKMSPISASEILSMGSSRFAVGNLRFQDVVFCGVSVVLCLVNMDTGRHISIAEKYAVFFGLFLRCG